MKLTQFLVISPVIVAFSFLCSVSSYAQTYDMTCKKTLARGLVLKVVGHGDDSQDGVSTLKAYLKKGNTTIEGSYNDFSSSKLELGPAGWSLTSSVLALNLSAGNGRTVAVATLSDFAILPAMMGGSANVPHLNGAIVRSIEITMDSCTR